MSTQAENPLAKQTPPNAWGSCFDTAAKLFVENMDAKDITICHGIGIANRPGQEGLRVAHAWLEFDMNGLRTAVDPIWLIAQPAATYRKNFQVQRVVEYDKKEFMHLWGYYDFPGPWDSVIKKFTSNSSNAEVSA